MTLLNIAAESQCQGHLNPAKTVKVMLIKGIGLCQDGALRLFYLGFIYIRLLYVHVLWILTDSD